MYHDLHFYPTPVGVVMMSRNPFSAVPMEICSTASSCVTYYLLSEKYANSLPACTKARRVLVRRILTLEELVPMSR